MFWQVGLRLKLLGQGWAFGGLGWVKIRVWVWVTLRGMRLTRLGLDWVSVRVWVTWIGLKRFGLG